MNSFRSVAKAFRQKGGESAFTLKGDVLKSQRGETVAGTWSGHANSPTNIIKYNHKA